jgi:hypothetical protein
MHPLNLIPTYTFRISVYGCVVLLSSVVMSVVQVFHLYDVECSLWFVESLVFHPSRCELTFVMSDAMV